MQREGRVLDEHSLSVSGTWAGRGTVAIRPNIETFKDKIMSNPKPLHKVSSGDEDLGSIRELLPRAKTPKFRNCS